MKEDSAPEIMAHKESMANLFGRVAPAYDQVGPRFFTHFGRRLVELARIRDGASVLDVATGRGAVLFPAAIAAGATGRVVGIDLADAMVAETAADLAQRELENVEVIQMDAEALKFSDASFDVVLCGLAIFAFPRPGVALAEMRRVLKPGGRIGLTTFWRDDERWAWLGELFGKYLPPQPEPENAAGEDEEPDEEEQESGADSQWALITRSARDEEEDEEANEEEQESGPDFRTHQGMEAFLAGAGFSDISIRGEEPDFVYASEEDWWATVYSHGMRATVDRIERTSGPEALQAFKREAFERLQEVKGPSGFHHMWSVLYSLAVK